MLVASILLSALAGVGWPSAVAPVAYVLGAILLALGAVLPLAGGVRLGAALTPFPVPRSGSELRTSGAYALVAKRRRRRVFIAVRATLGTPQA